MYRPRRSLINDINMVPFIDIVLVLLIVFMVSAPLMMQGLQVDLPNVNSQPLKVNKDETVIISINRKGFYYLNLGESADKRLSLKQVMDKIKKIHKKSPKMTILINGDKKADYAYVVNIIASLQHAGIMNVGLMTDPRDAL